MTEIAPKVERKVAMLDQSKSVLDAASIMVERYIGSVVVVGGGDVKGIFTERDLMRVIAQRRDPAETKLQSVMRPDIVSVHPDASIEQCLELMRQNRCRHLLVYEEERCIGIISLRDVAALMLEEKESLVRELTRYITG
ncbi:MAG: CBS domain-containing protein [Sulfurifustis sp.]